MNMILWLFTVIRVTITVFYKRFFFCVCKACLRKAVGTYGTGYGGPGPHRANVAEVGGAATKGRARATGGARAQAALAREAGDRVVVPGYLAAPAVASMRRTRRFSASHHW